VLGSEDGFKEPVGKAEAARVGSPLGPTLGILLGVELGPEDGIDEYVGRSEATKVGSPLGRELRLLQGGEPW
jgi:hypothetical protein